MNKSILRLLDANFNRSREALRTMEDYARFVLDDAILSGQAKQLRHKLCQTMEHFALCDLLKSRNTPGDVGTNITTESELKRNDTYSVLVAAGKRLTEALRVLEEYGKIDNHSFASAIEALRYESYQLEKQLLTTANNGSRFARVKLYVLLTESLCKKPILQLAQEILAAGVDCIQLREKDKSDSQLLDLATKLAILCHSHQAFFIMNDRPDIAMLCKADGVHLGQGDLPIEAVRKLVSPKMLIGKSTHSLAEAVKATQADYLAIGAIYASETKASVKPVGLETLHNVKAVAARPVVAIGGIKPENAADVYNAGANAIAVCDAIISSENPAEIVQQFLAAHQQH